MNFVSRLSCCCVQFLRLVVAGSICFVSVHAHAWNTTGHREVIVVAWAELSPKTRQAIGTLLHEQTLIPHLQDLPAEASWMSAALWPDALRDQPEPTGSDMNAPRTAQQWLQRARTGEATRRWHFADRDITKPFSQQPVHGLLEQALTAQIKLLSDPSLSPQNRAIALAWVSHLVADAHQPLHCASQQDPARPGQLDAGGNTVTVFDAGRRPAEPLSLHRWWDELPGHARPGTSRFETETTRLIRQAQQVNGAEIPTPPRHWIEESFTLARDQVYPGLMPDPDKSGAFLIRQDYWLEGRDITRMRLALAGRRLAHVVEQSLQDLR